MESAIFFRRNRWHRDACFANLVSVFWNSFSEMISVNSTNVSCHIYECDFCRQVINCALQQSMQLHSQWPLSRLCEIPWHFHGSLRHSSAALGMLSVTHIMLVLLLNTCMHANMQFTIISFRQLFPDKIFPLTFPWFLVKSLTFPWQPSNSLTFPSFPGFPDKWSLVTLYTKDG